MKAEHRKELQTNTLAAGMGRLVQRIKKKPERRTLLWVVLGVVVVLIVAFIIFRFVMRGRQNADRWEKLDADGKSVHALAQLDPLTKPGLAARFQLAWVYLWELGIKRLPSPPMFGDQENSPLKFILAGKRSYEELATEVGDDRVLGPEALYQIAVATESLAATRDPERPLEDNVKKALDEAVTRYQEVVSRFEDSAYAREAKERLKVLQGKESRARVEDEYHSLQASLSIFQERQPIFPELEKLLKKK
jgi:hypothetical protein